MIWPIWINEFCRAIYSFILYCMIKCNQNNIPIKWSNYKLLFRSIIENDFQGQDQYIIIIVGVGWYDMHPIANELWASNMNIQLMLKVRWCLSIEWKTYGFVFATGTRNHFFYSIPCRNIGLDLQCKLVYGARFLHNIPWFGHLTRIIVQFLEHHFDEPMGNVAKSIN